MRKRWVWQAALFGLLALIGTALTASGGEHPPNMPWDEVPVRPVLVPAASEHQPSTVLETVDPKRRLLVDIAAADLADRLGIHQGKISVLEVRTVASVKWPQ